ncbi:MAG: class I SAM-dependent methyltransferase [Bacteroidota bacterium]
MIKSFHAYVRRPVRFDYLLALQDGTPMRSVLDVGCGNGSPVLTKTYYPDCIYHGIEKSGRMLTAADLAAIDRLFELDLEKDDLQLIEDEAYDCVIASHVIEHLPDAIPLLRQLAGKLRRGGILYLESPSEASVRFPSMPGTLNFHDDPTHVRLYSRDEVCATLNECECTVVKSTVRRSLKRILLFPLHVLYSLWVYHELRGTVFWDILGFASVVIAKKS